MIFAQIAQPVLRPATNMAEDWMIVVLLFALVTIAYTRTNYPLRLARLWNSVWNIRIMRQAIREEPNTPRANLLFNASFFLLAALTIYLLLKHFDIHPLGLAGIMEYLLVLIMLIVAYSVKVVGLRVVQHLADGDFGLTEYEYNVFLINRMIGLVLLPLLAFIIYSPIRVAEALIVVAGVLFGVMVAYRMLRGVLNASLSRVPLFYIFFYICTLEILPVVVCVKALSN